MESERSPGTAIVHDWGLHGKKETQPVAEHTVTSTVRVWRKRVQFGRFAHFAVVLVVIHIRTVSSGTNQHQNIHCPNIWQDNMEIARNAQARSRKEPHETGVFCLSLQQNKYMGLKNSPRADAPRRSVTKSGKKSPELIAHGQSHGRSMRDAPRNAGVGEEPPGTPHASRALEACPRDVTAARSLLGGHLGRSGWDQSRTPKSACESAQINPVSDARPVLAEEK